MGTNYYLERTIKPSCEHCGRPANVDRLHIGKSSAGWCFSLHVIPESGLNSLEDWQAAWSTGAIVDEYQRPVTPEQMLSIIIERAWEQRPVPFGYASWDHFHRSNGSVPGPNGLVRHAINQHCIGHGNGTWDLIPGEFS